MNCYYAIGLAERMREEDEANDLDLFVEKTTERVMHDQEEISKIGTDVVFDHPEGNTLFETLLCEASDMDDQLCAVAKLREIFREKLVGYIRKDPDSFVLDSPFDYGH